jgi:ABC-type transport system involved in multi-copper enzyme maturation permease subunit
MLKLIIEKELREIIGSTKFAATFGVSAVLILLTFYVGAKNYRVSVEQYEAAKKENLRKMEGQTDWLMVRNHRIFLPPKPLAILVTGISNDVGRTIEVAGRGELAAEESRFNEDPVFAVFRFLDLDFIFQIVLSLFAILFAYDAINGEKERGTLRLSFANACPRSTFILGKIFGAFAALAAPLLVPILLGCLILPILGAPLTGDDRIKLALVILAGLLYFGVFLTLSVFVSSLTHRSSHSFLILLVIWIFAVLIVPRAAVLIAGRAVDVPSVDYVASQKNRLRQQLWQEDRKKMSAFKPAPNENPQEVLKQFNEMMQKNADERDKKMREFSGRLNEERRNRQLAQERLAFALARLSPTAAFSLAATNLAGTSIKLKEHFVNEATAYQQAYASFMKEKTGMNLGGGFIMMRVVEGEEQEKKPIDPHELPAFVYRDPSSQEVIQAAVPDIGLLAVFNLIFFAGAFVAFQRYDLR